MRFNILIGGKAGQGPNIVTDLVAKGLLERGFYVFYSRDYQSVIRGGHNFNILSFSDSPIHGNSSKMNAVVCFDENTEQIHKKELIKNGLLISFHQDKGNMFYAGELFKLLNLDFKILDNELKKLRDYDKNIKDAKEGFDFQKKNLNIDKGNAKNLVFINGSQATAEASIESGLEYYYGYPMTPATPLMFELGMKQTEKGNKHLVIELENEISVINTALGSSIAGGISMIGTSGGGFDLMTEGLSLAGMAEIPVVIYLAQRPGPSTGVATYTSQADLKVALNSGHGEFNRVVVAPGDCLDSIKLTNEVFMLSQKYKVPVILLSDKHLGESKFSFINDIKLKKIESSIKTLERYNSYEVDRSDMIATDDPQIINKNFQRREEIKKKIASEVDKLESYKIYGNRNSNTLIISWGSTKGAILDAIKDGKIDAKFIQVLYLEPFSEKLKQEIKSHKGKIIVIENNATSPLSDLVAEKTGRIIENKNKILKYDGRPFFSDELLEEIKRR